MSYIKKEAICGKEGKADCFVKIEPADNLTIEIESKIEKLFGKQIRETVKDVLTKKISKMVFSL